MRKDTWFMAIGALVLGAPLGCMRPSPKPVIYDTDIGADMDDTWTLALLLASPEIDLKLVVTDSENTEGKAKLVAKFLERTGRTDIPIGVGVRTADRVGNQEEWAKDYDLARYPGTIHRDGVQAMIDTIMSSPRQVTVLAVGPVSNLAEALRREPRITERARLVVMGGCIERDCFLAKPGAVPESNVMKDPKAARIAYGADWDVTMAPLDTAGGILLGGESYARVRDARNPAAQALMENYRIWGPKVNYPHADTSSSGLFDVVALSLLIEPSLLELRDMRLRVTDEGMTVQDPNGKLTHVAMDWKNLKGFFDMVVDRLTDDSGANKGGQQPSTTP